MKTNTWNEFDQKNIITAIKALKNSEFGGVELAKWIYQVAFSQSVTLEGTPAELLRQIYEEGKGFTKGAEGVGEELPENVVNLLDMVVEDDWQVGDLLLVQKSAADNEGKIYIYGGEDFFQLREKGACKVSGSLILEQLSYCECHATLRPSLVMTDVNHYFPEKSLVLTPEQEALIVTAESYLLRGGRMQYDDSRVGPIEKRAEFRWQRKLKEPEDYTRDEWGYTNCAGFTYDVYNFALGYDNGMYITTQLIKADPAILPYYYRPTGAETLEEQLAVEKEFMEALVPGDIIVIRRKDDSGHAMLYVGNGKLIHSTGSSYDLKHASETYEPTVRFKHVASLFRPKGTRYDIFHFITEVGIVRPLNTWTGGVPQNTVNRVKNMRGIVAEKLSSHNSGMTVNPGDEMRFTFSVYNTNDEEVSLSVMDQVPENSLYLSGAEKKEGNTLSWQIRVPAGETVTVSYTVKVEDNPSLMGKCVRSESGTVGGVCVKCPPVSIRKTLKTKEQEILAQAAEECRQGGLTGITWANEIYKKAFGVENILPGKTFEDITEGLFEEIEGEEYQLKTEGIYAAMVAPTLYGGRALKAEGRIRLARQRHLIVGDILVAKDDEDHKLYLYNGRSFLDLSGDRKEKDVTTTMERVLACKDYYAILRPSFVILIKKERDIDV